MPDLSAMSDDQLKALYGAGVASSPQPALAGMTNDQLHTLYNNAPSPIPPPGYTPDEIAASQSKPQPMSGGHPAAGPSDSVVGDIPRRVGTWVVNAVTGMMSPVLRSAPGAVGIDYSTGQPHVTQPQQQMTPATRAQAFQSGRDAAFNNSGVTEYIPSTETGRIVDAAGTGAVGGLLTGGGALASAVGGAVGQELIEHTPMSRLAAAMIGQVGGAKGVNMASRSATSMLPGAMDAETRALAQTAVNDYGITVPLAKASNNPFIRYADSAVRRMPFSGYGALDEANQAAFNRGLTGSFGEAAEKVTPEVLNRAYDRIGNDYNTVAARTNIPVSNQLMSDLQGVVNNARLNLSADSVVPVERQAMNILDTGANNNGVISGRQFKDLTARGGPVYTLKNSTDSGLRDAGQQFDSILKSHLAANATPEDIALLRQADTQYKALKTVEPLTMRADTVGGATPTTGDVSPAALLSRVNQQYSGAARDELGSNQLKDLAQIGQRFLKEPGSSGTAERGGIAQLMHTAVAPMGALLGHEAGIPLHYTLPPLAAALVGPPIAGSIMRSPSFVNRQINGPQFSPLAQVLTAQPLIANQSGAR